MRTSKGRGRHKNSVRVFRHDKRGGGRESEAQAPSPASGGSGCRNRGRQFVRVNALVIAGTHGREGAGGVERDAKPLS